ncbi:hypothetical protein GCM10028784_32630 [Myceligenerans cantabricum]
MAERTASAVLAVVVGGTALGVLAVPAAAADRVPPSEVSAAGVTVPADTSHAVALPGAALPALAADGLTEESHSRYVYDAKSRTVRATVSTTVRNVKPDQGRQYFYWNAHGIPVPKGARDIRATSSGQSLPVRFEPTEDEFTNWAMASFSNLLYGQSRTIDWSYTIPGDPIRSAGYTRVGKGYATFQAQAVGDPGAVSVEIVAPSSMELTTMAGDFAESRVDGQATWSASSVTDEYGIWSPVSLRNPDQADKTQVDVAGEDLTLLSFPGDKKWTSFVRKKLDEGLPVLEDVIGQEWPGGLRQIREDVSPEIVGYAWYDGRREEIVVGEDLDAQLFYHELTHTWVNGDTVEGRWLQEGLTEAVARRVVERTGGKPERPKTARDGAGSLALSTWTDLSWDFDMDDQTEDYAYTASAAAVEALLAGLDDEELAGIVSAILAGESAYEEPGTRSFGVTDWRRLLDLLENRTDAQGAAGTLRTWVLTKQEKAQLAPRADARKAYFALDEADGEWQPPAGIRRAMTTWRFADASTAQDDLGDAVEAAGRVQDAAAAGGFPAPFAVREVYESAMTDADYAQLAETLPRAADVTGEVSAAAQEVVADRDPVTELGELVLFARPAVDLAVQDLAAGDLEAAAEGAARASRLAGLATWTGILAVLLALGAVLLVARLVIRGRRRRAARALAVADATPWPPADATVAEEPFAPGEHGAQEHGAQEGATEELVVEELATDEDGAEERGAEGHDTEEHGVEEYGGQRQG